MKNAPSARRGRRWPPHRSGYEDRQQTGLALDLPICANIVMAHLDAICSGGLVQAGAEEEVAERYRARLQIRAESIRRRARQLSGGNQQKVVIASGCSAIPAWYCSTSRPEA